jgi:hypothetical protein
MPRRAAAAARRGGEFGTGLAGVGGLEDLAAAARAQFMERGFARVAAVGAIGQRFRMEDRPFVVSVRSICLGKPRSRPALLFRLYGREGYPKRQKEFDSCVVDCVTRHCGHD